MKTQSLSPLRAERLKDLITLANHPDRDQWHCLRCHRIRRGQFTASYSDIALRWGVSPGVVYSTVKALVKAGYLKVERFEHASLFTVTLPEETAKATQATKACNEPKPRKKQKTRSSKPKKHKISRLPRYQRTQIAIKKVKISPPRLRNSRF